MTKAGTAILAALFGLAAPVQAAGPNPMGAPPPQNEIPPGTPLCTSEADIMRAAQTQVLGITCFRVRSGAQIVVLDRGNGFQQVKLASGEHKGATAWMMTLALRGR
jgi:hypothetical protein